MCILVSDIPLTAGG